MGGMNLYDEPDYSKFLPEDVWTEILPRLWQGGTQDDDTLDHLNEEPRIQLSMFDTVVTLHAWSNPVDWHVREIRQTFQDGGMDELDINDVWFLARQVYAEWMQGRRVGVRCLSGLNRSGLIVGLVLMLAGHTADDAIRLMRQKRHKNVLCNPNYEEWLRQVDIESDGA